MVNERRSVGPGVILLAHPMMHDDTFRRAAVYLIEHRCVCTYPHEFSRVCPADPCAHSYCIDPPQPLLTYIKPPTHLPLPRAYTPTSRKEGAYGLVVNQLSDMTLPQAVEGGCVRASVGYCVYTYVRTCVW